MGVDAAVIVEMEGDGEADDDEDDSEGSTGEARGCGRKATAFARDNERGSWLCGLDFDLDQADDSSPPAPTMPYEPVGEWRGDAEWGGGFVEEPSVGEVAER